MALTARERLVRSYTMQIYIDGSRTFAGTSATYHTDIKICAAGLLVADQIQAALDNGYITQTEYDETVAYIGTPEAEAWKTK
jgi:hypothetical protein